MLPFKFRTSLALASSTRLQSLLFPRASLHRFLQLQPRTFITMSAHAFVWQPNKYPFARRSDHVDIYKSEKHGDFRVADPYNWLEASTEETDAYITEQEEYTRNILDQNPDRQALENEIRKNTNYAKVTIVTSSNTLEPLTFCQLVLAPRVQRRWSLVLALQQWPTATIQSVLPPYLLTHF